MTTPISNSPLVESAWLAEHLDDPSLKILDATWTWAGSEARPHESFLAERVPGALSFDHARVADPDSEFTDTRPSVETFSAYVGALGISAEDTVVVYSQKGTAGGASRAWWLFQSFGHAQVFVLDGGLVRWKAEGKALESGPAVAAAACDYQARPRLELVAELATLREQQKSAAVQIVDARPPRFFAGEGVFPAGNPRAPAVEPGRIPDSFNLPSASVVDGERKTMKSADELRELFRDCGVDLERPVVTTCSLGIGACTAALALAAAGAPMAAVFDGAWQVWGSDPSTPKQKGE